MAAQQIEPRPRIRAACSLCHISKTKCKTEGENNDPGRCDRCQSLGLQCSYPISTKRRGRPPKDLSQIAALPDSLQASTHGSTPFPFISGLTPYASHSGAGWMPESSSGSWPTAGYTASSGRTMFNPNPFPGLDARQAMGLSLSTPQPQSSAQIYNPTLTLPLSSTATIAPVHIDVQPATISPPTAAVTPIKSSIPDSNAQSEENVHLNLSEYLDPKDSNLSLYPPRVPFFMCQPAYVGGGKGAGLEGFGDQDPVSLGMLSNAEASMLVNKFHDHLNPTIAVLDPKLHTLDYLLQTSPILLSAVLSASAKHYYKSLSPSLLAHTKTILDRALSKGRTHISLVQSLMILTYTKPPEDTSGWMRIGTAVRMGYQMFLHVPRVGGLPIDEKEARVVLNAERTWYCLFCFDRSIAQCVSLPSSIRLNEIGEAETWAREHLHLGKSPDMHLAASIELCKMKDQWRAIFASETPSTSYCESAIESLTAQAEALYTKWFGRGSDMPNFSMDTEHVIAWCILDFIFSLKRQHYEMSSGAVMRMEACLASASQIVDRLEILSRQGVLAILQDTVSCMTSALGIFLHKIFWTCTILQKSHIANLLQRVLKSHESAAEDPTAAPAYVARCFKRILAGIGSASRGGSPMPNQQADSSATDGVVEMAAQGDRAEQDLYLQLEEFVRFQEGLEQYETVDEQFWQTLFSA